MATRSLSIWIHLRGLNRFISQTARAAVAANSVGIAYGRSAQSIRTSSLMMWRVLAITRRNLLGVAAIAGIAGTQMMSGIFDFEKSMRKTWAAVTTGNDSMTYSFEQMASRTAIAAGKTKFSLQDAAETSFRLAQAGFSDVETMDLLLPTLQFAQAADIPGVKAATMMAALTNSFEQLEGPEGAVRAADLFTTAILKSPLDASAIETAMRYATQAFSIAGWTPEELMTAMMSAAKINIKGSPFGTAMRYGVNRLIRPPGGRAEDALESIGLNAESFLGEGGKLRPMDEVLTILRDALDPLTGAQQVSKLGDIFGQRAWPVWSRLINSPKVWNEMKASIDDAAGAAEKAAENMQNSIPASIENMGNMIQALFAVYTLRWSLPLQHFFRNVIGGFFEDLTAHPEKVDEFFRPFLHFFGHVWNTIWPSIKLGLIAIAAGVILIKESLDAINPYMAKISEHGDTIAKVFAAIIAKKLIFGLIAPFVAWGFKTIAFAAWILFHPLKAIGLAWTALSLVFLKNPLGWILLAITGLAYGLYKLYQNSQQFRDLVHTLLNGIIAIVEALKSFWEWTQRNSTVLLVIAGALAAVALMASPFLLLVVALIAIGYAIYWAWTNLGWFRDAMTSIWNFLAENKDFFIETWNAIWSVLVLVVNVVRELYDFLAVKFAAVIGVIEGILGIMTELWEFVTAKFPLIGEILVTAFLAPVQLALEVWEKIEAAIRRVAELITNLPSIPNPLSALAGLGRDAFGGGTSAPVGSTPGAAPGRPGGAFGGKVVTGGMMWVGERGAELVNLPTGASIMNPQESRTATFAPGPSNRPLDFGELGLGGEQITRVYLDRRMIAEAVHEEVKGQMARGGRR